MRHRSSAVLRTFSSSSSSSSSCSTISFVVNGQRFTVSPDPRKTLLEWLREERVSIGTKLGCGEGGCGACTVAVSAPHSAVKSLNACLAPLASVDGCVVVTADGIGSVRSGALDEVQEAIAASFGSQCGFCTPGIVMAVYAYRHAHPNASPEEIVKSLDGNLCRCTGYRPIIDAVRSLPPVQAPLTFSNAPAPAVAALETSSGDSTWHRPTTLAQLLKIKQEHPEARIVVGNTEIGVEAKFKGARYAHLISPALVGELHQFSQTDDAVVIGAALNLTLVQQLFSGLDKSLPEWKTEGVRAVLYQLKWFASNQIRNVACIGGNIATASPISDLNPVWIATGATLELASAKGGRRTVSMRDFFIDYRKTALRPDEVIVSVKMPLTRKDEFVHAFKQARRKEDDIAIVTSCMRVKLDDKRRVAEASLAFGGMAAKSAFAAQTERLLIGREWNAALVEDAFSALEKDLPLPPNAVGGMPAFRSTLAASFFFKFHQYVLSKLGDVEAIRRGAFHEIEHELSMKAQQVHTDTDSKLHPVSFPVVHLSATKQVTGEAHYVDDMPNPRQGLFAHFVLSPKGKAKFKSLDASAALKMPGVRAFFSAADIPGNNEIGPIFKGEELFARSEVKFVGHPVGVIVAETHNQARDAAQKVQIEWESEEKPILTIADAIAANSFFDPKKTIEKGDVDKAFASAAHIVEGEISIGAQEHFYLEPQGSFVVPGEEMEVFASTQNPSHTQHAVADVLGFPSNRVIAKTRRLGGGFGGKETRSIFISAACAVAAHQLQLPVRMIMDRDVDFATCGPRHAFTGKYKVAFDKSGVLQAVETNLFSNAGYSIDLSFSVMERALFHSLNAYKCENVRVSGQLCKTNVLTSTAFRGFGGPQGMLVVEAWVDHIARKLGISPEVVRERNFIRATEKTHYNQVMDETVIVADMFSKLRRDSEFDQRRKAVDQFNKENRDKKRGLCLMPTVFGLSFTAKFLNQAGSLINVYTDGSVQINQSGTEMGQGLFTKMAQIAAHALGAPLEDVRVMETSTDKVPNTSPTAASVQTDINGGAVLDACRKLNDRLAPIRARLGPKATFAEICNEAYMNRISLSAQGFYATPNLMPFEFNRKVQASDENRPFNYYTQGVACSEVELDVLTGDFLVLRTDILMDVGNSINPGLDVGQIEGAFVQGMGWCTMEELVWLKNGRMFTTGPGAYKIPGFSDVPRDFRVSLVRNNPNIRAVHSSKGIGEPPLFLGAAVMMALKDAVYAARSDNGLTGHFPLHSPATAERLRMACGDPIASRYRFTDHHEHILPH